MQRRFPLAAVLHLREQHETAEERALLSSAADLRRCREAIARTERLMLQHEQNRTALLNKLLSAAEHLSLAAERELLRRQLAEEKRLCADAEIHRNQQQQRFLQARRDRETLTQLQEGHAREWAALLDRREGRAVDDFIASRHGRRH